MIIQKELDEAAKLNRERDAQYQDGYRDQAAILKILLPNGIQPYADWERITLLFMVVAKIQRYAQSLRPTKQGHSLEPHEDSLRDLGVYAFMMQAHDREGKV